MPSRPPRIHRVLCGKAYCALRARNAPQRLTASLVKLLHRREAGGLQERVGDALDDRAVRLGLGTLAMPFRIGLERVPFLLAVGKRVPFQQVIERLVRIADQDSPEAGLLDAVALPDLQGDR